MQIGFFLMKNRILEFQHLLIITHNYITTDKSSVLWVCHPVCFYKHLWKKGSYLPALLQSWSIGTTAISVRQCTFTVHGHLVLRCIVHKGRWRSADSVTEEFQNSSYINISTEARTRSFMACVSCRSSVLVAQYLYSIVLILHFTSCYAHWKKL